MFSITKAASWSTALQKKDKMWKGSETGERVNVSPDMLNSDTCEAQ